MTPLPDGFTCKVIKCLGEYVIKIETPGEMNAEAARVLSVHLWSSANQCDMDNARARREREWKAASKKRALRR